MDPRRANKPPLQLEESPMDPAAQILAPGYGIESDDLFDSMLHGGMDATLAGLSAEEVQARREAEQYKLDSLELARASMRAEDVLMSRSAVQIQASIHSVA
jgi:hypothetical protein